MEAAALEGNGVWDKASKLIDVETKSKSDLVKYKSLFYKLKNKA